MSTKKTKNSDTRKYSSLVVDGPDKAANRSMLRAVGFKDADFKKPVVGIASTWSMVTPCNMHIDKLALYAAKGGNTGGGKSVIFNTITVSDGISMGTPGMRYSLVSREVIADSIETVSGAEGFDGLVAIGGCDKNMPGYHGAEFDVKSGEAKCLPATDPIEVYELKVEGDDIYVKV